MMPTQFNTIEEIIYKLRRISKVHSFSDFKIISQIFYDVIKTTYYAIVRKKEGLRGRDVIITLKRKEITKVVKLIDYHYCKESVYKAEHELVQCFGPSWSEGDALRFFEEFVEGLVEDKHGRKVMIDLDDGVKFMYKDKKTGKHDLKSENYLPTRGKRLPWIRHTIINSSEIYTKQDKTDKEIMYVNKYELPNFDEESNKCYWLVIAKKYCKDKVNPYRFKTAFPIFKESYNGFLKRIERYEPIDRNIL